MSHSLSRVAIHLIFSTKNRRPLITDRVREQLHAYMVGILRNLDCPSIRTKTADDHTHALFLLSKKQPLEHVIEELKRSSSKWIKTKGPEYADFYWQIGYAAFSVGQEEIEQLITYIDNQQEHHRKVSFEEEVREFFRRYGVPFDEENFLD